MANLNELIDDKKYRSACDIMFFCDEGKVMSGKYIKANLPFPLSPNEPMSNFFKEVIKRKIKT